MLEKVDLQVIWCKIARFWINIFQKHFHVWEPSDPLRRSPPPPPGYSSSIIKTQKLKKNFCRALTTDEINNPIVFLHYMVLLFFRPENKSVLSALVVMSMLTILIVSQHRMSLIQKLIFCSSLISVYLYRAALGALLVVDGVSSTQ